MNRYPQRGHGFTLIELLVVIAIISIIAGFLVPTLLTGRQSAYKTQCGNNLKQIFAQAMSYADNAGTRAFPIAKGEDPRAHESVNVMLEYGVNATPGLFVCPSGEATEAETDEEDAFILDESSLAYTWVGRRTKTTVKRRSLSTDKYVQDYEDEDGVHDGHPDGISTVMTDSSVSFINKAKLEEDYPDTMLPANLVR